MRVKMKGSVLSRAVTIKNFKMNNAIWFILPAFIIYMIVIVIPSLYSLYISFFEWNGVTPEKIFVGFDNYIYNFTQDAIFVKALVNNVIWTVLSMIFTVGIALGLALILNQKFRGRTIFRGIFYFPYILSGIVVSTMWVWIYHPQMGFINKALSQIGLGFLKQGWLSDPHIAFYSVFVAALWQYVGAPMVLFLAGLQSIPKEPYESALIDGANKFEVFLYITIPMLKETFVIVFATTLSGAMKVFDIIYAMTGGGPAQSTQTLASWMYKQTFDFSNIGLGASISWILVIAVMIVTIPYVSYMAKD